MFFSTWAATSAIKTTTMDKEEHENEVQNSLAVGNPTEEKDFKIATFWMCHDYDYQDI
jgi:hypothetical protein